MSIWKRLARHCGCVLESKLFLPVSFLFSLFAITFIISHFEARVARDGDRPFPSAEVVLTSPGAEKGYVAVPFTDLTEYMAQHPDASPRVQPGIIQFSKRLGENSMVFADAAPMSTGDLFVNTRISGDTTTWFQYKVTDHGVVPVYSRIFYHGYMFGAMPFALIFALIVRFLGGELRYIGT